MDAALSSIRRQFSYPVYAALLFASFSWSHALIEAGRFEGVSKVVFVTAKILFGIAGYFAAYEFWRRPDRDWLVGSFFALTIVYSVFFMWLAPLYEVAYLQCAIGCAFFKVRNQNLFVIAFGIGLLGIYVTYAAQDSLHWTVPPASRVDWVFIAVIFFLLTWMIQKYAVSAFRRQEDRLSRLSLVGSEASTLLREVEARLQVPLDLSKSSTGAEMTEVMRAIQAELKVAQVTLRSFRAKTGASVVTTEVDVIDLWSETFGRLQSRLGSTAILLPPGPVIVKSDREILRSVFFNLLLNSVEFAERRQTTLARIVISWEGHCLSYADGNHINLAGEHARDDRGLGLEIIREDLKRLNIRFEIEHQAGVSISKLWFLDR